MSTEKGTILLVDKPLGVTSFDVVRALRKRLNIRKIGHAGTLDPMATGLLIIGVGDGTKRLNEYIHADKVYDATIVVGRSTTTGDAEGEVIDECSVPDSAREKIPEVLESMIGTLRLPVSVYSAMKQGGQPLYKKVRRGEKVIVPLRDMLVRGVQCKNITREGNHLHVSVEFYVESGVYIRSLAEEFGKRLGFPASLVALRRTRVGDFSVEDAHIPERF